MELYQVQAAPNPGKPRLIGNQTLDADGLAIHRERDRFADASVVIPAGEKGNKVKKAKDAELIQSLRLFFTYSLDIPDIG